MKRFPIFFFFLSFASAAFHFGDFIQNLIKTNDVVDVDMRYFDFYGNELERPDLSLDKKDAVCLRTGNDSELFRRFAGLLLRGGSFDDNVVMWDFWRVDQLKALYYDKESESESDNDHYYDDKIKTNSQETLMNFPKMNIESEERRELAEGFIFDLVLTLVPGMRGTRVEDSEDIAGILLLLFLTRVEDFNGYFEEFEEFYGLMRSFAYDNFELTKMARGISSAGLIEELFQLAVKLDLPYTLELFYVLELVDFEDESVFKFVVNEARCPVVLNRFFDFVPWKSNTDGVPKIHYIYENHRLFLGMLFEYEPSRVNWRSVDGNNKTLLGKLLLSSKSLYDGHFETRSILKNFLSYRNVRESAGTFLTEDRDILMECYDNEYEGLRLLSEYCDNSENITAVIEDYLERILEKWKESGGVTSAVKVFKFLVKRATGEDSREITPLLSDAFEFLHNRLSSSSQTSNVSRTSSSSPRASMSRSISGNFFKSFLFVDSNVVQKSPPRNNSNLEMMRFIAQEAGIITENENPAVKETVRQWDNIISDLTF